MSDETKTTRPNEEADQEAEQPNCCARRSTPSGSVGKPGEQIQNVISVGMLSEGWDAKTVTHIMGLRAFTSQLLCEQVVGRGLRRTSYDVESRDRAVRAGVREHLRRAVHVPAARRQRRCSAPTAADSQDRNRAAARAKAEYEITWPNVMRIDHVYRPRLTLD